MKVPCTNCGKFADVELDIRDQYLHECPHCGELLSGSLEQLREDLRRKATKKNNLLAKKEAR